MTFARREIMFLLIAALVAAAIALTLVFTLGSSTSSKAEAESPAPSTSARPTPQSRFLSAIHEARIPIPDDQAVELAHQQCRHMENDPRYQHGGRALAVSLLVLKVRTITKEEAGIFWYEATSAFCPDLLSQK